jgi:5-methylthioadenosine/S-adenosylhomocysteine deaminase
MKWIGALQRDYRAPGDGRITVSAAPELPEMVGAEGLVAAGEVALRSSTVMPTHLLASPLSRDWADASQLAELGAFGGRVLGAHCTCATPADLATLAEHQVGVAHCPTANAALGRMVSAAPMRAAGLAVGLGSDNASLNRNSDILAEARRAVMAARVLGSPDQWIDTHTAIEMATIEGARAIGMDHHIGSLTPGKQADLIVIDTTGAHWWPRHDWLDTLVSQGKSSDVRTVLIGGDVVLDNGVLSFLDPDQERRLTLDAQAASVAIVSRSGLGAAPQR